MGNKPNAEARSSSNRTGGIVAGHSPQCQGHHSCNSVTPLHALPIPRLSYEMFLNCLAQLPFTLSEEQFESTLHLLREEMYAVGDTIIHAGSTAQGIYVITKGTVSVLAADNRTVVRVLEEQEFFGEVSVVYKQPCSATIRCESDCGVIILRKRDIDNLLESPLSSVNMSLVDWFVHMRYVDLTSTWRFDCPDKAIARECLRSTPIFCSWSLAAVDDILEGLHGAIITLYPAKAGIWFEGDYENIAYAVISGTVAICSDGVSLRTFSASERRVLWLGDEALFTSSPRRSSLLAVKPCLAIAISVNNLLPVLGAHPPEFANLIGLSNRWKAHFACSEGKLYENYKSHLEVQVLCEMLRETMQFSEVSSNFLYFIVLGMKSRLLVENTVVAGQDLQVDYVVLVITGQLSIASTIGASKIAQSRSIKATELFMLQDGETDIKITALKTSVVGIVPKNVVHEALSVFPETSFVWNQEQFQHP